jgi:phage FluMu gp28-like protein
VLASYLRTGLVLRCCIDQTGIGMQLAENMQMEFGGLVEPVTFTNANKAAMAEKLRVQMEGGNFTFGDGEDEEISEDFASIEKIVTAQNNVRLAAAPGNQTHGDYFWAAALSLKAATDYGPGEIAMAAA